MPFFGKLKSYESYLRENPFHELLNISLDDYGEVDKKVVRPVFYSVDQDLREAYKSLKFLIFNSYTNSARILEFIVIKIK